MGVERWRVTETVADRERAALAAHLRGRVQALLEAWRAEIIADPKLTTPGSLPKAQLVDHLPVWLETLAVALSAAPGDAAAEHAHAEETHNAEAHGLQRWQQGYDLHEVTREWGALNRCLVAELDRFFAANPTSGDVAAEARATLASLIGEATSESAAQYFSLERLEAAGTVSDLEQALRDIRALEKSRAELWQEAAHDLRGNLGVVSNVSVGLGVGGLPQERRDSFLHMLRNNLGALHRMLDDVTDLARLHAGQEQMRAARFDATQTLTKLCNDLRPMADSKQLTLTVLGRSPLMVEGDEVKVRRIAQNLLLNAMKYTVAGGVVVDWGDTAERDDGRWWFSVVDTGPGFHAGPGAPLVGALGTTPGESPAAADARPVHQPHGEGLGLAIVKRLCELLGASLELDTAPDRGTTIRVLVPLRYPPASG